MKVEGAFLGKKDVTVCIISILTLAVIYLLPIKELAAVSEMGELTFFSKKNCVKSQVVSSHLVLV